MSKVKGNKSTYKTAKKMKGKQKKWKIKTKENKVENHETIFFKDFFTLEEHQVGNISAVYLLYYLHIKNLYTLKISSFIDVKMDTDRS